MTATLTRKPSAPSRPASSAPDRMRTAPDTPLLAARVQRWGTSSVAPFVVGPDRELHVLPGGGVVGFVRRGRWAVLPTDPVGPPDTDQRTAGEALELLAALRLRPVIAASAAPERFRALGLWTMPIADDAVIDLPSFTLSGSRMANLRHSVAAAERAGLRVVPWSAQMRASAAATSARWLATKRGGEMGFTLGRFDPDALDGLDCRVVVDGDDRVQGLVTWHPYANGTARVLDLMRRDPDAPGSTMDLLLAESLRELAAGGMTTASLGAVPRSHGSLGERVYPTRSLQRYKQKFAPRWEPLHLVVPHRRQVGAALRALALAYSPDGVLAACRRNA